MKKKVKPAMPKPPIIATQRLAKLSSSVVSELQNFLIGINVFDRDIIRAADILGFSRSEAEKLRTLRAGEFYAFGPLARACRGSWRGCVALRASRCGPAAEAPSARRRLLRGAFGWSLWSCWCCCGSAARGL